MATVKCNKRAAVECTLYVNTRSGYMFTPQRFPSISQAVNADSGELYGMFSFENADGSETWGRVFDVHVA